VHRTRFRARRVTQGRLRMVDLVQRSARALEALERAARRSSRSFPRDEQQDGGTEESDTADEEQQTGE
jgi:hypothetical protein